MQTMRTEAGARSFSLEGETALITGGGTGLGLGIARCMAAAGARVVLVGRRESELERACADIGPSAVAVPWDVTRHADAPELVRRAEAAAGGPISILVNNAGNHLKKPAAQTTVEEFQAVLSIHVLAAHALTAAVAPGMTKSGRGSVLFTSSMAAFMGVPLVVAYAAAKSACFGLVATWSAELAPGGVRVNAIAPGWIRSAMTEAALERDPARKAKVLGRIQLGRMGEPDDIGWAAVYLCSPAAAYVTGVTLPVDGGATAGF